MTINRQEVKGGLKEGLTPLHTGAFLILGHSGGRLGTLICRFDRFAGRL